MYWGDIGFVTPNYIDFRNTILQYITGILYYVFATPSQVSFHSHPSICLLSKITGIRHDQTGLCQEETKKGLKALLGAPQD